MYLKVLPYDLTVCKTADTAALDLTREFYFIAKTDEELSLVCQTADAPACTTAREDGWRGMRIEGQLDFSLVGILARISDVLALDADFDLSRPVLYYSTGSDCRADDFTMKKAFLLPTLAALAFGIVGAVLGSLGCK